MANLTHDAHPIPPEIERAIADFGDGTAEAADETLGTPGWQKAMRRRDLAWAALKVAIAELARDKERLDRLESALDGGCEWSGLVIYPYTVTPENETGICIADLGDGETVADFTNGTLAEAPTFREVLDMLPDLRRLRSGLRDGGKNG